MERITQEQAPIPVEVVAAITAAIAAVMDQPVGNFAIRSIQPVARAGVPAVTGTGLWAKAGLIQAHMARAQLSNRGR